MKYKKSTLNEKAVAEVAARRQQYANRIAEERGKARVRLDAALRNQQEQIDRLQRTVTHLLAAQDRGELVPRRKVEDMASSRRGWAFDLLENETNIQEMQQSLTAELPDGAKVPANTPEGARIRVLGELVDLLDMVEDETVSTHALEQAGWKYPIPR